MNKSIQFFSSLLFILGIGLANSADAQDNKPTPTPPEPKPPKEILICPPGTNNGKDIDYEQCETIIIKEKSDNKEERTNQGNNRSNGKNKQSVPRESHSRSKNCEGC